MLAVCLKLAVGPSVGDNCVAGTACSKRLNEQRLIQQAKDFSNQLARQKHELDKADMFPANNSSSEVSQMRESLLGYYNDLAQTEERTDQLHYKIQWSVSTARRRRVVKTDR